MRRHRTYAAALLISLGLTGCSAAARSLEQAITDTQTTSTVKYRLATDERLGTLTGIHVTTKDDWVYLTGTVADEAQKARIQGIVADVAGSNRVVNQLRVEPGALRASDSPRARPPTAR